MTAPISELRKAILDAVREATDEAVSDALFTCGYLQTCLNCSKFDEAKELCKAAGARPPARVIAFGCEAFVEDGEEEEVQTPPPRTLVPPPPVVKRYGGAFDDVNDDIPF